MKKIFFSVGFAVLIAGMMIVTLQKGIFDELHYRFLAHLYEPVPGFKSKDIVIIGIDAQSQNPQQLGKFKFWYRDIYAGLVSFLTEAQARVIAFDLLFTEPSNGISMKDLADKNIDDFKNAEIHPYDAMLVESLKKSGKVVLADSATELLDEAGNPHYRTVTKTSSPLEIFKKYVQTGWVNSAGLKDKKIFSVPVGYKFNNELAESFPFTIARKFFEIDQKPSIDALSIDSYMFYEKPKMFISVNGEELKESKLEKNLSIPIKNGQMYINYQTLPSMQKFPTYSFAEVYKGKVPKELFKDKIVLIGIYDAALNDYFLTPISDSPMFGIEIHANAIQTIIDENFIVPQKTTTNIMIIGGLTLLTAFAFNYLNLLLSLLILAGAEVGYFFLAKQFFSKGILPDMFYPFAAIALTFVTIYLYKYLTEYRDKRQLKNAFSHYVHPTVVKQIMKNPQMLKLGGQKRTVTVFFSDIRGFTSVSESMTPEQLVTILNEYLEEMTNVILEHGGTVDKYEGDAIMAFWNAPLDQPDHALLACRTALECRARLQALHATWAKANKPLLDFRVGLATGEAIVGNMGSNRRFEYTVIGDTINLGSRLESANKFYGTNIMISDATQKLIADHYVTRPTDLIRVKGRQQPVFTYEVICPKEALNKEVAALLSEYANGFNLYLKGLFSEAHKIFYALNKSYPQDSLIKVYLLRCGQFLKVKPAGWDGVWTMSEK